MNPAAACAHCGLPCARAAADGAPASFCCSGCFLAHRLRGADLEGAPDRLQARVVLSAFLAMGVMVFSLSLYGSLLDPGSAEAGEPAAALRGVFRMGALAFTLPVFALLGLPLLDAVWGLRRWLSSESLVLTGACAALAVSTWNTLAGGGEVYFDTATMVLVLFSLGRWLEVRARERARRELSGLAPERELPITRVTDAGDQEISAAELARDELVRVRPGECLPVDGSVVAGRSFVDTSALTGEHEPRSFGPGQRVLAGGRLVDGSLVVRAEALAGERMRDGIARLLDQALGSRSAAVRSADRLSAVLLPAVLLIALGTLVLHWNRSGPEAALLASLSVVLISCPCALGIAMPLAFWTALGAAWRAGVLVQGGEVLERLARARRVYFDKTGTLTTREPELLRIEPRGLTGELEILGLAAALEQGSEHPLGRSVRRAFAERVAAPARAVEGFGVLPGEGVEGRVDGRHWVLRRADSAAAGPEDDGLTRVQLEDDRGQVAGLLHFRARLAPGARASLAGLRARGLAALVLTGDQPGPARALAAELQVEVRSECTPQDKLAAVRAAGAGTLFVGDGLNDAAALAAADVGISVAGGSAASLDAAAVNLLRPGLDGLVLLLDFARASVRAARFNLAWALAYNAIGLVLAAQGRLSPIFAASAMVVSSLVVVLNSGRLRRIPAGPSSESADSALRAASGTSTL